jgi:excinuclease ABC subunit C
MVVFEGGAPKKSDYRRFKIRGDRSAGPDDVSSIEEVLGRRLARHAAQADLSPHDAQRDASFAALPDLIVIDGGKGQLAAGMRALAPLVEGNVARAGEIAVIGLAKRLEEVFVPGRSDPVPIDSGSEALRLLQRVRDEAHRFAIEHHRGRRDRAMTHSLLDELRGVGPVRRRALLSHFGSPERLVAASREELESVPGIPGRLAREIHRQLNKAG